VLVIAVLLGLLAAGCAGQGHMKDDTDATRDDEPGITFVDRQTFDEELSAKLGREMPRVAVDFMAPAKVNELPERLDKWLSAVEKYHGKVVFLADPEPESEIKKRSLIGLVFSLAVGVYNLIKEEQLYGPVRFYNATVYYSKSTGCIREIEFARK